ncbi:MAG: spore gernimation protein [Peptococcaceae bacterium BICA1-7]|nr:MAG: spore gernimation protein [Peptococcaceae bacterium BICA1-7]HBV96429.1 Ger(x)C family spore germination protein [Desulfotomaculum sp.]
MVKQLLMMVLLAVVLTGCWDAKDIDDLFIPFVGGYDLIENAGGKKYSLTVNFPTLSRNAKENSDVMVVEGETIAATRIDRGNKSSRGMAIGDLRVVLFGNDLARRGVHDVVDLIFRDPRFSNTILLAVTEVRTTDIITIEPHNYQTVGQNIIDLLRNSPKNSFIPRERLHLFRKDLLTEGFNPVLPVIGVHGNNKLKISGAALFKKYKMVSQISTDETAALVWLRGQESYGDVFYSFTDQEGKTRQITFEGQNSRSVKAKLVDGLPVFEINVNLEGYIAESIDTMEFAGKEENVAIAARALEEEVRRRCEALIYDLQNEHRVDAILLGRYARAKWPPLVQKQDWDEVFCKSAIKVKVNVKIESTGEVA